MSNAKPTLDVLPNEENTPVNQARKQKLLNNAGTRNPRATAELNRIRKAIGYNYRFDANPEGFNSPEGFFGLNPAKHPLAARPTNRFRFPFSKMPPKQVAQVPKAPVIQSAELNNASSVNSANSRIAPMMKSLGIFSPRGGSRKQRRRRSKKTRRRT